MTLDLITFEVLKHRLASIADEMMFTLQRSGYSPTTTQAFDFSVALCTADGRMIAQGLAVAGHLGSIPSAVSAVRAKFADATKPGDVFLLNDPYEGGMHLPDIFVIKPVFVDSQLIAFACSVVHHTDVGGRAPGSMAHDSTEIYQEGLRLPPTRLYEAGELNETLTDIIARNVRIPEKVMGDLRAEAAACRIGEIRILELAHSVGTDKLVVAFEELMDYSERLARAAIAEWPDGVYAFTDYLDDDGLESGPIPLVASVTIHGDSLTVDYSGTRLQVPGAINCTLSWTKAWTYAAIRCAMNIDIPSNDGYARPIEVIVPSGTILNMRHPAACAARGMTGHRIPDVIFGALAQAIPDRIPAASQGGTSTARFGVYGTDGLATVFYDNVYGTRGATPRNDGPDGLAELGGNLSNVSVEVEEAAFPLMVREYAFLQDSEGAGQYRGSFSIAREWEVMTGELNVTFRTDRRTYAPYGLAGGEGGRPSATHLVSNGQRELLPTKINRRLKLGDVLRHIAPSGGGWGNPLDRDPQAVLRDWSNELVSIDRARRVYGVVVDPSLRQVDLDATLAVRHQMHLAQGPQRSGPFVTNEPAIPMGD